MTGKIGKGCVVAVAGFVVLVAVIMWATSGVTGVVDEFIEHLAQDRHDEAYQMLGSNVTTELKREDFEDFLLGTRLRRAQSGSWTERSVNNGEGNVSGNVTLKDGNTVFVKFFLQKTDSKWLIEGIHFDEQPDDPEETEEFKKLGSTFVDHLAKGEFDQAYAMFGDQLTKDLDRATFTEMLANSSLDKAEKVEWTSSKPANMGGSVEGTVTAKDGGVIDLKLNLEKVADGLLIQGINFKTRNGDSEVLPLPTAEKALEWSQTFLAALATYMDTKDPKPMAALCHSNLAAKIVDQDALAGVVAKFPDPAGLRIILDAPIVLTKKPTLSDAAYHIESRTEVDQKGQYLSFQLVLSGEKGAWTIVNLDLQTRSTKEAQPAEAWKP